MMSHGIGNILPRNAPEARLPAPLQPPPINDLGEGGFPVHLTAANLVAHTPGAAPKSKITGPRGLPGPLVLAVCDATSWKHDMQCSIPFD